MLRLPRRAFLAGEIAALGAKRAAARHGHREPHRERLNEPGRIAVPGRAPIVSASLLPATASTASAGRSATPFS